MAATHKLLGSGQLATTTNTALYTVPADTVGMVKTIRLHNVGATETDAEIFYNGAETSADEDRILNVTVNASESFEYAVGHMLPLQAGEVIRGKADSATTINYHIFGAEE